VQIYERSNVSSRESAMRVETIMQSVCSEVDPQVDPQITPILSKMFIIIKLTVIHL